MHKLTHSYYAASRTTSFEEIHQQAAKTVKLKGQMNLSYPKKSINIKEPIISTSDNAGTPQLHLADLCQYSMGMLVRSLLDTAILLQNDWLILIDLFVSLFAFWFFFLI